MNRIEYGYCSACRRRHPRYQAVPDFPEPERVTLRSLWKFVVGIAGTYIFVVLLLAMGGPHVR